MAEGGRTKAEDLGRPAGDSITIKRPWGALETTGVIFGPMLMILGFVAEMNGARGLALVLAISGLLTLIAAITWRRMGGPGALTLQLHEQGLLAVRGRQRLPLAWADIKGSACEVREHYANGKFTGYFLHWRLWKKPDFKSTPVLVVRGRKRVKDADSAALVELVAALVTGTAEAWIAAIARGEALVGEGFSLQGDRLTVGTQVVPLVDISEAMITGGQLKVWIKDESLPSVSLPATAANASQLRHVLSSEIEKRGSEREAAADSGGLGRVIFERTVSRGNLLGAPIVAVMVMGIAALGLVGMLDDHDMQGAALCILFIVAAPIACTIWGLWMWRFAFRCHQRGVYRSGLMGATEIRYVDLKQFGYTATRHYTNGVYTGTHINMRFIPTDRDAKEIAYSKRVTSDDDELDRLRDHVSRVIASQMLAELQTYGEVQWTHSVRFLREGLSFRAAKILGKGELVTLPWERIHTFTFHNGVFALQEVGNTKPVLNIPISELNFFPGFIALGMIMEPDEQPEEPPLDEEADSLSGLPSGFN